MDFLFGMVFLFINRAAALALQVTRPRLWVGAILVLLMSSPASAQQFVCERDDLQRIVRLEFPGRQHFCEVSVTDRVTPAGESRDRSRAGKRKVQWYANQGSAFCSVKVRELVDRYRTKWNFSCSEESAHVYIGELTQRQRSYLDVLMKQVVKQSKTVDPKFKVVGVHVHSNNQEEDAPSVFVIQMGVQSNDGTLSTDRTYVVDDDGAGYKVTAIHIGLDRLTPPDTLNTLIASTTAESINPGTTQSGVRGKPLGVLFPQAIVSSVNSDGSFVVNTRLQKNENTYCSGTSVVEVSAEGTLLTRDDPTVKCLTENQSSG